LLRFVLDYGKNLWFIVWTTVPLMLLAGFLGSVVATLLPNDLLRNVPFGFLVLFMASLVGTFLPVPIGFDVAVAGALLNGGLRRAMSWRWSSRSVSSASIRSSSWRARSPGAPPGCSAL
jgi:uncharacterized membrane protein YraQ (UPF0718 family)